MRRLWISAILLGAGLLVHAQVNERKPFVLQPIEVERIYASAGDPNAIFDAEGVQLSTPLFHYHLQIHFAGSEYLEAIYLPMDTTVCDWQATLTADDHRPIDLPLNKILLLQDRASTLDIHLYPRGNPAVNLMRESVPMTLADWGAGSLPRFGPLSLYHEDMVPHRLKLPQPVAGRVLTSSVEEPATRYHPTFLFDGRKEFGWGTDHGQNGAGESIALSFDQPLQVSRIKIWNGNQMSVQQYLNHPRARILSIGTGSDTPQLIQIPDDFGTQVLDLPRPVTSSTFQLRVDAVYPGDSSDVLVLAELQLGDGETRYRLAPDREGQLNSFVRAKTKGTALGDLLDWPIVEDMQEKGWDRITTQSRTVIFGSDGSFYFQLFRHPHTDAVQYLRGFGGWEHFLPQDGRSRVKVWGHCASYEGFNLHDPATDRYFEADLELDSLHILPNPLLGNVNIQAWPDDFVFCDRYAPVESDLRYCYPKEKGQQALYPPSECVRCLLRDSTAQALARAQHALDSLAPGMGYRFLIWDAYRPLYVQKLLWEAKPDTHYVANPYAGGSSHNRGTAIDLTLIDQQGQPLNMGTDFDEFSKRAHHGYTRLPKRVRANRLLLKAAMEAAGFVALPTEWWHYRLPIQAPIADMHFPSPH